MNQDKIEFPVQWHYKIICLKDDATAFDQICKTLRSQGYAETPEPGLESKQGKYQTYKVSITFYDLDTMRQLSELLGALPCVKFML
ncbi:MAG: DUF493 domain-containing protein [Victivallales bacterium]|nr:DUF493 domain-containing protein [Victivallales bacterium]